MSRISYSTKEMEAFNLKMIPENDDWFVSNDNNKKSQSWDDEIWIDDDQKSPSKNRIDNFKQLIKSLSDNYNNIPTESAFSIGMCDLSNEEVVDLLNSSEFMALVSAAFKNGFNKAIVANRMLIFAANIKERSLGPLSKLFLSSDIFPKIAKIISKTDDLVHFSDFSGIVLDFFLFMPKENLPCETDLLDPLVVQVLCNFLSVIYQTEILEHTVMSLALQMELATFQGRFKRYLSDAMFSDILTKLSHTRRFRNRNLSLLITKYIERLSFLNETLPSQRTARTIRHQTDPVPRAPLIQPPRVRYHSTVASYVDHGFEVSERTNENPQEENKNNVYGAAMCLCNEPIDRAQVKHEIQINTIVTTLKNSCDWRLCEVCLKNILDTAVDEKNENLNEYLADSLRSKISSMAKGEKCPRTLFLKQTAKWNSTEFIKAFSANLNVLDI